MMAALLALPLAAWLLLAELLRRTLASSNDDAPVRRGLLWASALWSVAAIVGSEGLSLLGLLQPAWIATWWLGVVVVVGVQLARTRPRAVSTLPVARPSRGETILSLLLAGLLLWLLVVALFAPPTIFDTLTYHLPRQVLWLQQGTLAHFETNNVRQLMMPPLAEVLQLQFLSLAGGDRFVTVVSWASVAMSCAGASLVAGRLGGDRVAQLFAALFVVLIPMAIMQAPSAKNDAMLALWVVATIDLVLGWRPTTTLVSRQSLMLGVFCGLALLTKGTAAFLLAPFLLLLAVRMRGSIASRAGTLGASFVVAMVLNAGHFARNYERFGSPSGPLTHEAGGYRLLNETYAPASMISTLVRNVAINLGSPWTAANSAMSDAISALHRSLDVDPDDPRTTFGSAGFPGVQWAPANEDTVGAPVHLALVLAVPFMLVRLRRQPGHLKIVLVAAAIVLAFILFSVVFRWQVAHARLQLPLVVAACPVLAVMWRTPPFCRASLIPLAAMMAVATPTLLDGPRPLTGSMSVLVVPREEQLLRWWSPEAQEALRVAADVIAASGTEEVVLRTGGNSPDYVLMELLRTRMGRLPRFVYASPEEPAGVRSEQKFTIRSAARDAKIVDEFQPDGTRRIQVPRFVIDVPTRSET